jgi:hypothetical protein
MISQDEQELFAEGIKSYGEAMIAIREFKYIVCRECKVVINEMLPELSKTLGRKMLNPKNKDYGFWTDDKGKEYIDKQWKRRDEADLSVGLNLKDPDIKWIGIGLWWGKKHTWIYSGIYLKNMRSLNSIFNLMNKNDKRLEKGKPEDNGSNYLYLYDEFTGTNVTDLAKLLKLNVGHWIKWAPKIRPILYRRG